MNIKKYLGLVMCALLLSSSSQVRPMDLRIYAQLKNGVIIVSAAMLLVGASYGFYRTLNYLFPPKKGNGPRRIQTQRIGDITSKGGIVITQKGTDDDCLEVSNITSSGDVVISQKGSRTTRIESVVSSGKVSVTQNTDDNADEDEKFLIQYVGDIISNRNANDATQTVSYNLSKKNIYAITAQGIGKIVFVPVLGDHEYVTLRADKDIIKDFEITFDDKRVFMGPKQNSVIENVQEIMYTVCLKDIVYVELSGQVEGRFDTKRKENELHVILKDQAKISSKKGCDIDVDLLTATCSGLSSLNLKGRASKQQIYLSGGACYNGQNLVANDAYIKADGSGKISVNVQDQSSFYYLTTKGKITGVIDGNYVLKYKGNPDISQLQRKSLATIKRIE